MSRKLVPPEPKFRGPKDIEGTVRTLSALLNGEHMCPSYREGLLCKEGEKLLAKVVKSFKYGHGSKQYKGAIAALTSHFNGERVLDALAGDASEEETAT